MNVFKTIAVEDKESAIPIISDVCVSNPRINFETISVRNFFSYGNVPTTIELGKAKYNLVTGKNGSGKSTTLLDGLSFALYNKPYKKVNKSGVVNSINRKKMF